MSPKQWIIIQKYIHNRLPVNKPENMYYGYRSSLCYVCNKEIECQHHILQCIECKARTINRKSYIMLLKNYFELSGTNPTTSRVIISYLDVWLKNKIPPSIDEIAPEASTHLIKAVTQQNKIGWDQWFNGRIAITWGEMYNHDLRCKATIITPQNGERLNSVKRGKTMLNLTWQFVIECWITRNESEHELNGNHIQRQKEKAIEKLLRLKSKIPEGMSHPDVNLDKDILEKQPVNNIIMITEQISMIIEK
jgi:hypothetical protein